MKNLARYVPVALWCGVIFFLSSLQTIPSPKDTILNFVLKKIAHVSVYAILYWLTFRATNKSQKQPHYLGSLLFVILYAISDEIHQSFISGRHARAYDVGFDTLGAFLAIGRIRSHFRAHLREKI